MNILIPLAGKSQFFPEENYKYPFSLIEVFGHPMIELVIKNLKKVYGEDVTFNFVFDSEECEEFHIDDTVKLLTDSKCNIVKLKKRTRGALCSALMAIDHITGDEPLIVCNGDQIFKSEIRSAIESFQSENCSGALCFESVHPRWAFVREYEGEVIETAEKRPIGKNAVAGFYYFRSGDVFIKNAMRVIEKEAVVSDVFYISTVFNEMVLDGEKIKVHSLKNEDYHSFYTPQRLADFEKEFSKDDLSLFI